MTPIRLSNHILVTLLLLCLGATASAQGVRVSYKLLTKNTTSGKYSVLKDMKTDFFEHQSFFYCERTFLQDSLAGIAYDSNGEIADKQVYQQLVSIKGGTDDMTILDTRRMTGEQYYIIGENYIIGETDIQLPKWTVLPDSTKQYKGYMCKTAVADYLGRTWTVLFTENIPVNSGPWFLWGTPGLILHAFDEEKTFQFEFMGVTSISSHSRKDFMKEYYQNSGQNKIDISRMSLRNAEKLHTKYMTDADYFSQNLGGILILNQASGGTSSFVLPPYTPLIPSDHWK